MSHKNVDDAVKESTAGQVDKRPSFSLWRVTSVVGLAMLVVVPTLFWLERNGLLGTENPHSAHAQGGFRRREVSPFDLSNVTVPKEEIRSGGPAKDGIPALSQPRTIDAKSANYLTPEDRVIGVAMGDEARAYPIRILNYHEIVNDELSGQPIAVTYCPLCDSAAVFDRNTPRGEREFGVSGLLYNSNVLMYDRDDQAESLWSQLKNEAIAGEQVRNRLKLLPVELTTWGDWQSRYPATTVLSPDTGHRRNYSRSPYASYFATPSLMFPVQPTSDQLPAKEKILGVRAGDKVRAYPRSIFSEQRRRVEDQLDGKHLVVEFDPATESLRVVEADEGVTWMYSLWFSWYAMHPETEVFE
ncbi:MAG: DUF3179 domain-containing protein [Planctomycetes bacterium]|nr:DUF3179 domain-containing protein [Planctomycetota bacterium]